MAIRGFRTKIALNVALLVLLSAVLTDVLLVLVFQRFLVRSRLEQHVSVTNRVVRLAATDGAASVGRLASGTGRPFALLLNRNDFPALAILDANGGIVFERTDPGYPSNLLRSAAEATLRTGKPRQENLAPQWAVFWWAPRATMMSLPIEKDGRPAGAVTAVVSLAPVYDQLRQYNKPVLYYIVFNSVILTLVGLYRIFRIYLHPIDRIVRQADEYGLHDDMFFTFRREDNELNRLSSALNRMLKRIAEDQQKLKASVVSLGNANRELKEAQNEIVRAEKMASVGRLAAGIAHEIGNPIGIVLGYLELLRQPGVAPEEFSEFVRRTEQEIQRINTIIRQLLDLARPKENAPSETSIHGVLEEIAGVMRMQPVMHDIQIDMRLEAGRDMMVVNPEQLRQVFLNLLLNAADAIREVPGMPQGRIEIDTWNGSGDEPKRSMTLGIRVSDNGKGIAPEQIDSVFDPFFTTKEPGKGTGLGLAVSYMVIQKMGGTISVQSLVQAGTAFTIVFPLAPKGDPTDPVAGHSVNQDNPI